jgi:ferredoxin
VRVYRDDVDGIFGPVLNESTTSIEYVNDPKVTLGGKEGTLSTVWAIFSDASKVCNLCGQCAKWCVTGALVAVES